MDMGRVTYGDVQGCEVFEDFSCVTMIECIVDVGIGSNANIMSIQLSAVNVTSLRVRQGMLYLLTCDGLRDG